MEKYKLLWSALDKVDKGSLLVKLPNGEEKFFDSKNSGPQAQIIIKDMVAIDESIHGGDVGFGETYMQNLWETPNLIDVLSFFTYNSHSLEYYFHAKKLQSLILFFTTLFRKNNKNGSKKNISYHYDIGNDFYKLWLDQSMTYSSAIFADENTTLLEAQKNKYSRILSKLNSGNILEIGCGWGGFANQALENGFQIDCLTLSKRQKEYAENILSAKNFGNKFKIKLQDYRDEKNQYDNIVSIEMFEAVGKEYWDTYFQTVRKSLKKGGKAVLQIITIDDEVFQDYKNRVDFIQKHIFPGGVLPSKSIIRELIRANNLELVEEFAFGMDYAKTLEIWLKNFNQKEQEILKLGLDEIFIRKWRFYLSYCIAGFASKRTDVVQFEIQG